MKNRLSELRHENKLTQQELAEKVKVTRRTIISIESGKYSPSLELAFKLADFFHLTIEKIFLYKEE
ncbi:helix-turn-helix transcriptional regulator [Clostridium akagii]|uniref:helix-turn-helix transcriptional regulator n=1 Tax=Clostridium akagii TaxID=91623 RepID=UPI00047EFD82|nr:helix-turn-helix transcriptional regulator [Clostridium akagii]